MHDGIVLKTRVRLARNLKGYFFPNKLDKEGKREVVEKLNLILDSNKSIDNKELELIDLKKLNDVDLNLLLEKHLISKEAVKVKSNSIILSEDKEISILLNEEDHVRIQVIKDGLKLKECLDIANKVDDYLEEDLEYDFDIDLGYLTSCPTNIGTGLRASVMVHLPALSKMKKIDEVKEILSSNNFVVRGMYGEKSNIVGSIYQISNNYTLGYTEEELIVQLEDIIEAIVMKETEARQCLKEKLHEKLEDELYRSLGVLCYSRIIDIDEAIKHISNIKLGVLLEYIDEVEIKVLDNLIVEIQPAHQSKAKGKDYLTSKDIDRATYIRKVLSKAM